MWIEETLAIEVVLIDGTWFAIRHAFPLMHTCFCIGYAGSRMRHRKVRRSALRLLFVWALLVFLPWAANGEQPVFPSDSEDPRQAGGLELLETVCPGRVASGKEGSGAILVSTKDQRGSD